MSLARTIASLFGSGSTISASILPQAALLPPGSMIPFGGASAPTGWHMCFGQALSRSTEAALFAAIGTSFGVGDGSTTFNLPDLRGRIPAGKDDMGGTAAGRLNVTLTGTRSATTNGIITDLSSTAGLALGMQATGTGVGANAVITAINNATSVTVSVNNTAAGSGSIRFGVVDGATLGAAGGTQLHRLSTEQMPAHTHSVTAYGASGSRTVLSDGFNDIGPIESTSAGNGQNHPNVQPTLISNYIIKA